MQIPILNGIFISEGSDFRTSYPRNLVPILKQQGISKGYLHPADGISLFATGNGIDRGGINWKGICYRVIDKKFVAVNKDGSITDIGYIGGEGQVSLDYSTGHLGIASSGDFYLWNGLGVFNKVIDKDLGAVISFIWVDGYFMTTDGESIVVTELNDPFSVNQFKYGASEVDPDPIKAILKLHNEPHAVNRYTIEAFNNIGGDSFPFQRVEGTQIHRGSIGTHSCVVFMDAIAFIGGGRNESISVWLGGNGQTIKLATREIDQILLSYDEEDLINTLLEVKVDKGFQQIYIHLPDQTLVYDYSTSKSVGIPVWFKLTSGIGELGQYLAKNFIWCYNKWIVGHPNLPYIGYFNSDLSSHWGELTGWEFSTLIIYDEAEKAQFHQLELMGLSGNAILGDNSTIWTQYSYDGITWSIPRGVSAGLQGERTKRMIWLQQGIMHKWRIQKFKGTSDARFTIAALEARIEGMAF